MNKTILITGGAGFIGSNFILYLLKKYKSYKIINLDKLTYAADLKNLSELENIFKTNYHLRNNYQFIHGCITDTALVQNLFTQYNITDVIHFAAESHVDNSISNPKIFLETNIMGTYNLLNAARNFWMDGINQYKPEYINSRFHHISTDEVFGSLELNSIQKFNEQTNYSPNSPYSASKASSDFIVSSFYHTYGLNILITNCSNNYGPRQHNEKLIPTIINKAINLLPIPLYGDGQNIRDWLFVEDHCEAIDLIFHQDNISLDTINYNIGGNCELSNLEVVHIICDLLNIHYPNKNIADYKELIQFVTDRPGHDRRYAIDCSKLQKNLNWQAQTDFKSGILKTLNWYI